MDNPSYHSRQLHKIPNSSQHHKGNTIYVLKRHILKKVITKKEQLEVLSVQSFKKKFVCDLIASYMVLTLLPYYCIFNPID